ncbi:MIP/aquaporin family protein [Fusobacterium polymorphum]|uniref:MIP/aquaporin family protein n=1 Tax=Fusobacterium nucleatum subsp. polymorphum TaxID=76857 RepID=UPI003D81BB46
MSNMSLYIGEFVGTTLLLLLGNGVNMTCSLKHSYGKGGGWIVTTFGWGFAVMIPAYVTGWVSGAHMNPALTIALAVTGKFPGELVFGYIIAQMLGGIVGATLAYLTYKVQMDEEPEAGVKLGVFSTGPSIDVPVWNVVTEIIATALLLIGVLAIGYGEVGIQPGNGAAFFVGLLIVIIGMATGGATGYALNPARDLGPRIAHAILPIKGKGGSNWKYSWVPVVGPIIGAVLGAVIFDAFIAAVI